MKKMYFKLLCTLFVAACSMLQAAEQHNGVTTIENAVKNPLCICYNSLSNILIGGSNGFQLVDKDGKSKSEWGIRDGLQDPFYQILTSETCWYAISFTIGHRINLDCTKVDLSPPLGHYRYRYLTEGNPNLLYPHPINTPMPAILLRPHPYESTMPLDYNNMKYHSLAMHTHDNVHLLAILTHDNTIQFWLNNKNNPEFLYAQPLDKTEKLDESTAISQRLAFAPDGLSIAVALKNKCFIIPVSLQPAQEKSICQLLLMLKSAQQ